MFTYERTEHCPEHFRILCTGNNMPDYWRVQPFGAIFYGLRGDREILVKRAVKTMNRAYNAGECSCLIQGCRRQYFVSWDKDVIRGNRQLTIVPA